MSGAAGQTRAKGAASDRVVLATVLIGFAWLVFYALLVFFTQDSPSASLLVGNVVYLVPIAAAAGLSIYAATRTRHRVRTAWRLLAVSNLLWFAGEFTWARYAYQEPGHVPMPSFADVGYFLSYLIAVPAIVVGLGAGLLRQTRRMVDALLVAAGGAALGWQLLLGPLMPTTWNAGAVTAFIYPVLSVSLVSILAAVVLSGPRHVPRSMVIAGAAFGIAALTDAAYAYLTLEHEYRTASWLNMGWQAEAVLLCIAAVVAGRSGESDERPTVEPDLSFLPVMVAVVTVCGVALADLVVVGELSRVTLGVTLLLLVGLLVRQVGASRERTRVAERLRSEAITDSLTDLYNRRHFEEMLVVEAASAVRHGTPLSVVLLDLDHFKEVNDTYGHATGDAVLAEVALLLRRSVRAGDLICRYGGEEFACLLPGTDGQAAVDLAERIRAGLCRTPVTVRGSSDRIRLTASFGVASAEAGQADVGKLVETADQALYRAKALGRDRVVGSGLAPAAPDPVAELPPGLVWLADRIDVASGEPAHAAMVSSWATRTAVRLGLDGAAQRRVAAAARLHDLGKVVTSAASPAAQDVRRHPEEGARLLVELADRPDLAPLVAAQHENFDGTGYPRGLAGTDIPIGARIIAACDAWARMRAGRPPTAPLSEAEARRELVQGRGTRFDPAVVDTLLDLIDESAEPGADLSRTAPGPAR
ncbi:bifunctional diguanylate cyclase/phosphohydrolase [Catellatospora tritici]|uniref:bifunctional diguanylate cyclase/phosphohydrolase n=1 Tax=Catellatospora tritici TaxID=2851566 RepID=UPI001C2D3E4D|nr:diguanylate cyclase [Catellatospora tritici]MBV1852870.1 diguanylate cyclase [Catellatospora tritici]